jgi:hypothetical protein
MKSGWIPYLREVSVRAVEVVEQDGLPETSIHGGIWDGAKLDNIGVLLGYDTRHEAQIRVIERKRLG